MLENKPQQEFNTLFDKKNTIKKHSSFDSLGSLFFAFFLLLGIYTSLPVKNEPVTSHYPTTSIVNTVTKKPLYAPDLIAPSILNYKTTQTINKSSYKDYLNKEEQIIDFTTFSHEKLNYQLNEKDIMNGVSQVKHLMIQEDLSIVPFKSGEVTIESEIIETTQSQNFYMVEVLKTFTQGKKVVKVLERKVFDLKDFETGHIHYIKNILYTSSNLDN